MIFEIISTPILPSLLMLSVTIFGIEAMSQSTVTRCAKNRKQRGEEGFRV